MTQKKDYMKPAMKVVEVRIESHLLAASTDSRERRGRVGATMKDEWEEEDI